MHWRTRARCSSTRSENCRCGSSQAVAGVQEKQIVKLGGIKPVSIDFRLVAANNQDLEALVEKKRFRSDLFFRLNVLPLWIPPLRERREEIVPLCLSILEEMNAKYGTEKVFSEEVKRHLARLLVAGEYP